MKQVTVEQAMQIALGHHQAGRLGEAEGIYRRVLAEIPEHADALHLLGVLACQAGHPDAAINLIGRAIAINPTNAEYRVNLGETYRRSGELDLAIECFHRALEIEPDHAETHNNLGIALKDLGRLDEAIASYGRAIELNPSFAEAHCNLGVALHETDRCDEAVAAYDRAIQIKPELAAAHNNRGNALRDQGRLDEAIDAYSRAIALAPDLAAAHNNLGNLFREQGRLDLALASYRRAVEIDPAYSEAVSNLVYGLHFHPDYDAQAILKEHRNRVGPLAGPLVTQNRPHGNDRTPDRRLKVGFVSSDFRGHAVGYSLLPLFAHLDREKTEIVCYSGVKVADEISRGLQAFGDRWQRTVGMSDQELADRIRADRVDILVDLALHTAGNRVLVFARKPAPVQVTMLGMPATTGLATMDYRITDPYLDPPGLSDGDSSEQSIRLPHCYWCYQPPEQAPPIGELPAWTNGFITFGCRNHFAKVSRPALQLWINVLQSVPGARLIIQSQPGRHLEGVYSLFEDGGIARDRVEFVPKVPQLEYLQGYHALDLSLDPFPYNGHTSSLDSLWMGVPVITLAGRTAVGRGGVSILSNLGLTGFIARTPQQYVDIAVEWAGDRTRLSELRAGLRQQMQRSPLVDGKRYAADVEAALRRMWQTWCGQPV